MNLTNSIEIAVGIILAVLVLAFLVWLKDAPKRARANRKREQFEDMMHQIGHDIINGLEKAKAEAEQTKKPRRKPATKKAPVKKQPVAPKKGATNVKARR
jgi:hypothetical protein